jgi:protein BCP1
MGKKRSRETDGQGDVSMADPTAEKRDEDSSDDDEVRAQFTAFFQDVSG